MAAGVFGSGEEKGPAKEQAAEKPAGAPEQIPAPPDVGAPPPEAQTAESGLAFRVIQTGTGTVQPRPTDLVTVHYTGWTSAGKMLDSSVQRGKPIRMVLKRFIPGWQEALRQMVVGEERRLWIPERLAFQGNPTAPAGMIVYDVRLLDIQEGPETPPSDVAAPPPDAGRTRSGIAFRVLTPGRGSRHATARSSVTVHYTGWTTDGKMFDSSVVRGTPANFALDQVIPGWTEGLQLMVEGEKRRFWIPEKLAYRGQAGKPKGMLVFDVELLAIQS